MRDLINKVLMEGDTADRETEDELGDDIGHMRRAAMHHFQFPTNDVIAKAIRHLLRRSPESLVFGLVLSGIPFDDAVNHIAKRDEIDPYELRATTMAEYKRLRGDTSSYDDPDKVALIMTLNKVIREACETLVRGNAKLD